VKKVEVVCVRTAANVDAREAKPQNGKGGGVGEHRKARGCGVSWLCCQMGPGKKIRKYDRRKFGVAGHKAKARKARIARRARVSVKSEAISGGGIKVIGKRCITITRGGIAHLEDEPSWALKNGQTWSFKRYISETCSRIFQTSS